MQRSFSQLVDWFFRERALSRSQLWRELRPTAGMDHCRGEPNQTALVQGQSRRACSTDSRPWPHKEHIGEFRIRLEWRFAATGSELLQAFHRKVLTFWGTLQPQIIFHNSSGIMDEPLIIGS